MHRRRRPYSAGGIENNVWILDLRVNWWRRQNGGSWPRRGLLPLRDGRCGRGGGGRLKDALDYKSGTPGKTTTTRARSTTSYYAKRPVPAVTYVCGIAPGGRNSPGGMY